MTLNQMGPPNPDTGLQRYGSAAELVVDACEKAIRDYEITLTSTAGIYLGGRDKAAMRERIEQLRNHIAVTNAADRAGMLSTTRRLITGNNGPGWYSLFPYRRRRPSEKIHYVISFKDDPNDPWSRPWAQTYCGAGMKIHSFYEHTVPDDSELCQSCLRSFNRKGAVR